jgi:hypothetical protein
LFKVDPLENGIDASKTLTDIEILDVYYDFMGFCGIVKKNSSTSETLQTTSVPSEPISEESQTTKSFSDSGSTVKEESIK